MSKQNIEVNREQTYYVYGYDKDADVYETLCESPLYDRAVEIAASVIYYHKNVKELRRTKTDEPFDWFVVSDTTGNPLCVFTFEFPDGCNPEDL